jgi:hypothetical protein
MTTTIRAHFDGKQSLVLEGPVDLPVGKTLRVHIEPLPGATTPMTDDLLAPVIVGLDGALVNAIASDPDFDPADM